MENATTKPIDPASLDGETLMHYWSALDPDLRKVIARIILRGCGEKIAEEPEQEEAAPSPAPCTRRKMPDPVRQRVEVTRQKGADLQRAIGHRAQFGIFEIYALEDNAIDRHGYSNFSQLNDAVDFGFYRGYSYAKNQTKRRKPQRKNRP